MKEERQLSLTDLRALQYEWKTLIDAKGYARLQQVIKEQLLRRQGDLFQPTCQHPEFMRGECAALSLISRMAEIEFERLGEEIRLEVKRIEREENSNDDSDDAIYLAGQQVSP